MWQAAAAWWVKTTSSGMGWRVLTALKKLARWAVFVPGGAALDGSVVEGVGSKVGVVLGVPLGFLVQIT